MDIYFCDLCGVRVTDADLRAGHGIRSHWDVICGTCLEMGHGKDWLSQRTKLKAAAASPTLDAARDRLATLDEEAPAPVAGKPIRAMRPESPPEPAAEPTPVDAHPVLSETDLTSTARVPSPVRAEQMHLASAANMFSALGQTPRPAAKAPKAPPADATDDLTDNGLIPAMPEDATPARGSAPLADTVSPFGFGQVSEKEETVAGLANLPESGDDLALDEAPAKDKPSSGTSSRHKKSGTSSRFGKSAAAKGGPGKLTPKPPGKGGGKSSSKLTARSRRGSGKDSGRMVLYGSMISLALIGIAFVVMMQVRKPTTRKVQVGTDLSEITAMIKDTEKKVNDSLRSDELPAMESALATLNSTASSIEDFEKTALKSGDGEDKVEGVLRSLKWPDVYAQSRNLRDRIGIKKQQR